MSKMTTRQTDYRIKKKNKPGISLLKSALKKQQPTQLSIGAVLKVLLFLCAFMPWQALQAQTCTLTPVVSSTSAVNTCPTASVNLNTLVSTITPTNASLIWFANNTHSGTAYATPYAASAGTFHAYYYNSVSNCYSSASAGVVVSIVACPPQCNTAADYPAALPFSNNGATVALSGQTITGSSLGSTLGCAVIPVGGGSFSTSVFGWTGNAGAGPVSITYTFSSPVNHINLAMLGFGVTSNTATVESVTITTNNVQPSLSLVSGFCSGGSIAGNVYSANALSSNGLLMVSAAAGYTRVTIAQSNPNATNGGIATGVCKSSVLPLGTQCNAGTDYSTTRTFTNNGVVVAVSGATTMGTGMGSTLSPCSVMPVGGGSFASSLFGFTGTGTSLASITYTFSSPVNNINLLLMAFGLNSNTVLVETVTITTNAGSPSLSKVPGFCTGGSITGNVYSASIFNHQGMVVVSAASGYTQISITQANPSVGGGIATGICKSSIVPDCRAGNTAPVLNSTTVTNNCPVTTANLNLLVTSTTPASTSLVWFNNSAHSGTAIATPTTATAGTYYAYYYDALLNCYSPASAAVTIDNICPDTDGDGVVDANDLDEDNDGILDDVECQPKNIQDVLFFLFSPPSTATTWNITVVGVPSTSVNFNASNYSIPATGVLTISITGTSPSDNTVQSGMTKTLTASAPVSVLHELAAANQSDTWLVYPKNMWGKTYRLFSYVFAANFSHNQYAMIYSDDAGNVVTLKNKAGGTVKTFTLNAGQSYLQAPGAVDMTGWTISSSKKTAVIVGVYCANGSTGACDNIEEMLLPTEMLGTTFFIPNAIPTSSINTTYVMAETAATIVKINGIATATLNAGDVYSLTVSPTSNIIIETTAPATVWQLTPSNSDPSWLLVPDATKAALSFTIRTAATMAQGFLHIVAPTGSQADVLVNGASVPTASWTAFIGNPNFSFTKINTTASANYSVSSTTGNVPILGVYTGYGSFISTAALPTLGNYNMLTGAPANRICEDTDTDGQPNIDDLDSDNDACSDANEYYASPFADGGDNGMYGTGIPAVDANGKVIAAAYAGTYAPVTDNTLTTICFITLPVELLSFEARCRSVANAVDLSWQTASELNNAWFEVQRSEDAINWQVIEKIKGAGTSKQTHSYSSRDHATSDAKYVYYRLKQTDFDGQIAYSKIVSVSCHEQAPNRVQVVPNPFNEWLSIISDSPISRLSIYNNLGELVLQNNSTHHRKELELNLGQLPTGVYILIIESEVGPVAKKIIKD